MSIRAADWAYSEACDGIRGAGPRGVLGYMAWKSREREGVGDVCDRPQEEIGLRAGVSRKTAGVIIEQLCGAGALRRLGRAEYLICVGEEPTLDGEAGRRSAKLLRTQEGCSGSAKAKLLRTQEGEDSTAKAKLLRSDDGKLLHTQVRSNFADECEVTSHLPSSIEEDVKTQDCGAAVAAPRRRPAKPKAEPKPEAQAAKRILDLLVAGLRAIGQQPEVNGAGDMAILTRRCKQYGEEEVRLVYEVVTRPEVAKQWPVQDGFGPCVSRPGWEKLRRLAGRNRPAATGGDRGAEFRGLRNLADGAGE